MQAKLLIHVVDASSPQVEDQISAVKKVLTELGCAEKPTLLVLNKIDKIDDQSILHVLQARHPNSVSISAVTRQGIDQLREAVISALSSEFVMLKIEAYSGNGKLFAYLASNAEIIRQEFVDDKALFVCSVPKHLLHKLEGADVTITKM